MVSPVGITGIHPILLALPPKAGKRSETKVNFHFTRFVW